MKCGLEGIVAGVPRLLANHLSSVEPAGIAANPKSCIGCFLRIVIVLGKKL